MSLPKVEVVIDADTRQAETGLSRVGDKLQKTGVDSRAARDGLRRTRDEIRRTGDTAEISAVAVGRLGQSLDLVGRKNNGFSRGFQNASFQINDFATQVGAGTSASIALGQQLPQLLQGMGLLGAAIATVVAVGLPLTRIFQNQARDGGNLSLVLGDLHPLFSGIASAMRDVYSVASRLVVPALETLANNMDRLLIAGGVVAGFFVGRWVVGMAQAKIATFSLQGAIALLSSTLSTLGKIAVVAVIAETVHQMFRLTSAAGGAAEAFGLLGGAAVGIFRNIGKIAHSVGQGIVAGMATVAARVLGSFAWAGNGIQSVYSALLEWIASRIESIKVMGRSIGAPIAESLREQAAASELAFEGVKNLVTGLDAVANSAFRTMGESLGSVYDAVPAIQQIHSLLKNMKEEKFTLPDIFGVSSGSANEETEALEEQLSAYEQRIKAHNDRLLALTQGNLSDRLGAYGSFFTQLGVLSESGNNRLFKIAKSFVSVQALMDTWGAYAKTLREVPFPANLAAAGAILTAGLGAVNNIRNAVVGGGGGAANPTAAIQAGAQANDPLSVRLTGFSANDFVRGADIGELLERLQDEAGDRGLRFITS